MVDKRPPSDRIEGLPAPISELPWSGDFVMQSIELLLVALTDAGPVVYQPDCADSFIVGWPAGAKPEEVAVQAIQTLQLKPTVVHSTSWRHSNGEVVLTYLAVVSPESLLPPSWESMPVGHAELARGSATAPPPTIGVSQVLEHALRHLAWLVREDDEIRRALPGWVDALDAYVPEPFRALGGPPG